MRVELESTHKSKRCKRMVKYHQIKEKQKKKRGGQLGNK